MAVTIPSRDLVNDRIAETLTVQVVAARVRVGRLNTNHTAYMPTRVMIVRRIELSVRKTAENPRETGRGIR
jgi:hypothetical protein